MKYIDSFRNPQAAQSIVKKIRGLAQKLETKDRRLTIMEVCGTHTMAIARFGIRDVLPTNIRLVSGPGCPVCVTDSGYIDAAIDLARQGVVIGTFGDLINVPGSTGTLAQCRSQGAAVEVCYSPLDMIDRAKKNPEKEFVFLSVGFETTMAPILVLLERLIEEKIKNVSLLTAFKLVPPALSALGKDPQLKIDAFLCPAHVSAIIGADAYKPYAGDKGVPCVIAGFEPLDILLGVQGILEQWVDGRAQVENQYARVVTAQGNAKALKLFEKYLEPEDAVWRGIGAIPKSGLKLKKEFLNYDATIKLGVAIKRGKDAPGCRCGDVVKGICEPTECPLFGKVCTPDAAVGPCMVSSEGSCAAVFKYQRY